MTREYKVTEANFWVQKNTPERMQEEMNLLARDGWIFQEAIQLTFVGINLGQRLIYYRDLDDDQGTVNHD